MEQILPEGIRLFPKHEKAPDFVIAAMVITLSDLEKFFKDKPELLTEYNGKKQLKLQILKSKDGKPYATVDTFKKTGSREIEDIEPLPF